MLKSWPGLSNCSVLVVKILMSSGLKEHNERTDYKGKFSELAEYLPDSYLNG